MIKSNIPSGNSSGIRIDGYNDMVQVYDPYKKSWVDYQNTGVIVLPSTIIITTATLNGQPVTCVIGDYSETTVFVDGVATFKNIFVTGTATVTSSEFSVEVEVSETGRSYEGVLEEIVETVLWDGTSAQNGAVRDASQNLIYEYSYGAIDNSRLCVTFKTTISYGKFNVSFTSSDNSTAGSVISENNGWYSGSNNNKYVAGTTYYADIADFLKTVTSWAGKPTKKMMITLYDGTWSAYQLTELSKIWLE